MQRKLFGILTALLLLLTLTASVCASETVLLLSSTGSSHVTDEAGILSAAEEAALEGRAAQLSQRYDFGLYIYTIDDYRGYTGGDIFDAGMAIYDQASLGYGAERNGLLLLLSMERRDYTLLTHGDYSNYAFTQEGREAMTACFLDDFQDNDWYDGFSDYLDEAEEYLEAAEKGQPYTGSSLPRNSGGRISLPLVLLLPLAVAGVVILVLNAKMKTVAMATQATAYVVGDLELSRSEDRFTHTTETRTRIEDKSSSGGRSRSSGSFSGTSGKF